MKNNRSILAPGEIKRLTRRFEALQKELSCIGPISQGSVMHQPPGAWRWTRKVKGKTVSVGLSAQQAGLMNQAIVNQRRMDMLIDEMRQITQQLILQGQKNAAPGGYSQNPKAALT